MNATGLRGILSPMIAAVGVVLAPPNAVAQTYESKAVVEIHPRVNPLLDPLNHAPIQHPIGAHLPREIELIQSFQTLTAVVTKLDLAREWHLNPTDAVERLQTMLKVSPIKGTDRLEIRVHSEDRDQSRVICSTVAEAYKERRNHEERNRAKAALEALQNEVRIQEAVVEEKRKLFLSVLKGIGEPAPEGRNEKNLLEDEPPTWLELTIELTRQKKHLETQLAPLQKLKGDERLRYAAELDLPHNPVATSHAALTEARRSLEELTAAGIAADHPAARNQAERVRHLTAQTEEGIASLEEKLREISQLSSAMQAVREAAAEKQPDNPVEQAAERALRAQDYDEMKEDYEDAAKLLKAIRLAAGSKGAALKVPPPPITIDESPDTPEQPVEK